MSLSGMLVNTVDIRLFSDPINVAGKNVPQETLVEGVKASVQQSSSAARNDQDIEGAIASGKAFFDHDPGVRTGDRLIWGGRTLECQAPALDEAGRGVLWTVRWTEVL